MSDSDPDQAPHSRDWGVWPDLPTTPSRRRRKPSTPEGPAWPSDGDPDLPPARASGRPSTSGRRGGRLAGRGWGSPDGQDSDGSRSPAAGGGRQFGDDHSGGGRRSGDDRSGGGWRSGGGRDGGGWS